MAILIEMPQFSPTMTSGKILQWYKKIGDKVRSGDPLVEIETDKSILDYESVETGYLVEIKEFDGHVTVGTVICVLSEKLE